MATLLDVVKKGSTDRSVTIRIIDATAGTPETGVVFNTAGIDLWYRREGATKTNITEADLATPALDDPHLDGGFLHIGNGEYRLDLPDAACATAAEHVDIGGTVTDMVVIGGRVRLVDVDLEDAVRLGLTALPNAAADAAGGLTISDAGGLDLDTILGRITANVALASIATEARLAELDAANLPTDVDLLVARLTAARAGYLDNLSAGAAALASAATEVRLARLDTTVSSRSSHDAAAVKTAIEAGGSSLATLLTRITAALETKGEADTAHALLATAAALTTHDGKLDTVDGVADAIKLITDKFDAARPEPSQGQPPKNPTFWEFMAWLWMGFRNKEEETASEKALYNDAGTKLAKATLADDATTFSKAKFISGA